MRMVEVDMPTRVESAVDAGLGRIVGSGRLRKSAFGSAMRPYRVFGYYALVYLVAGDGIYADPACRPRRVEAGDLILVFPDRPQRYGPRSPDAGWCELYVVFDGPVFDRWRACGLLDESEPVWRLEPTGTWGTRLASVVEPTPPQRPAASLGEVVGLQRWLADAVAVRADEPSDADASWLARAKLAVESAEQLSEAAAELHCSYATFRRRFTTLAGVSPGRYQAQRRIEQACALMHAGELSDKQIAAGLGFCDEHHFSRRFKQLVGLSPRGYRRGLP